VPPWAVLLVPARGAGPPRAVPLVPVRRDSSADAGQPGSGHGPAAAADGRRASSKVWLDRDRRAFLPGVNPDDGAAMETTVTVRYFAAARDVVGKDDEAVPVDGPTTVAALRSRLVERHPALLGVLRQSRLAVNERFAAEDDVVAPDADVAVIPPVAGG
jgi:molybdopterin converting factor subunit 1